MPELDDIIKTNKDFLTTETTFDPALPVETVVWAVRKVKTTGQLVFHLSQGGVQKVALVEKTKANESQSKKIRELLGMI